jgi:hypothetical protein
MKPKIKHYELIMALGIVVNIIIFVSLSKRLDRYIATIVDPYDSAVTQ